MSEKPKFSLRTKAFAFTYPKCPLSPLVMLEHLLVLFGSANVTGALVAQERHADESLHLHAGIWVKKRRLFSDAHFADVDGHHGCYEAIKSERAWVEYLLKDGNYVAHGVKFPPGWEESFRQRKTSSTSVSERIATHLMRGGSVRDAIVISPGFVMRNLVHLQAFSRYVTMEERALIPLPTLKPPETFSPVLRSTLTAIQEWLRSVGLTRENSEMPRLPTTSSTGSLPLMRLLSTHFPICLLFIIEIFNKN